MLGLLLSVVTTDHTEGDSCHSQAPGSPRPHPDGLSLPCQPLCMPACGDMCEQHHVYSLKYVTPRFFYRPGPEQANAGVGGGGGPSGPHQREEGVDSQSRYLQEVN